MKFLLIIFLLRFQIKYNNSFLQISNTYVNEKESSGNDEKHEFKRNETEIKIQLYNLQKNLEKKRLLEILQDDKISIYTKLELVKDNRIKAHNVKAGGLINIFD